MLALVALLAACSPEHNWRQITFEGTNLKAQLPCKPDRTSREVPLGGAPVQLAVAGCESGGAMLAVMTAALAPGADAQAVLQGPAPAQGEPWSRPGLLPLGASQRVQAEGRRSDGQPVTAHAVWGAFAEGDHIRVVHAVVYAPRPQPQLAQTLFEGVQP
jgi:pimeloyl-ACP methyl ester carboxylesterase